MGEPTKLNQLISSPEGPENYDLYTDIELSEDEQKSALLQARQQKYFQNKIVEYKKKISEVTEYTKYKPSELYQKIHDSGFIVDETNKQIIWNLCQYFAGNPNGPYNLRKGICLYGPVGCYKTSLMKFFTNNQSSSFVIYSVHDVLSTYKKDGDDGILKYKGLIQSTDTLRTFGQTQLGICFDDFGDDVTDVKHFGNELNVMSMVIKSRFMSHYDLIAKTHLTTNISSDTVEERYGYKVRSRLREMINLVEFPDNSPDRRV